MKSNLILFFIFWLGLGNLLESKALTFTTIQQNGSVDKDIVVSPGELYEVSFDLVGHTTDDVRFVVSEGSNVLVDESTLADGAHQYYFTAVGSTVTLTFQRLDPGTDSRMFVVNGLSFLKQEEKVCQNEVGEKQYELSDHLGNIRVVISDNPSSSEGKVISATDYYPYGMEQADRSYSTNQYRFGFNGKENDKEYFGANSSLLNYEFRGYNTRIVRFTAIDPLARRYSYQSPYVFASNCPIKLIDFLGLAPGDPAPGESKGSKHSDKLFVKQSDQQKKDGTKEVLAPNGKYIVVPASATYTYSTGAKKDGQQKLKGVWQVNYEDGSNYMWDNVKGKYVLNTSHKGGGENSFPGLDDSPGTTYAGGDNPLVKGTIDEDGKGDGDYSQPPQNLADYGGKLHDQWFDKLEIAGGSGVLKKSSSQANEFLITFSQIVVGMYLKGDIDPFTGAPVSEKTYKAARNMIDAFRLIEDLKNK